MIERDYSLTRGVADEAHWNEFVVSAGGELVAPLIRRDGVKNADYLFRNHKILAELKVLETEFFHSKELLARFETISRNYYGIDQHDPAYPLQQQEIIKELNKPLQRIIKKANRQIKSTKIELGLPDYRGVLIVVNDGFRGVRPGLVVGLIGNILSGTSYKSIDAVVYQTNHYVEIVESPFAVLLWSPMYSKDAEQNLVDFINDLGRQWRAFSESVDGPYDTSEERDAIQLAEVTVVNGPRRKKAFRT
jgi:hypothetical protein